MVTIESHFRVITRVIHVDLNRIENLDSADLRFFQKIPNFESITMEYHTSKNIILSASKSAPLS